MFPIFFPAEISVSPSSQDGIGFVYALLDCFVRGRQPLAHQTDRYP